MSIHMCKTGEKVPEPTPEEMAAARVLVDEAVWWAVKMLEAEGVGTIYCGKSYLDWGRNWLKGEFGTVRRARVAAADGLGVSANGRAFSLAANAAAELLDKNLHWAKENAKESLKESARWGRKPSWRPPR